MRLLILVWGLLVTLFLEKFFGAVASSATSCDIPLILVWGLLVTPVSGAVASGAAFVPACVPGMVASDATPHSGVGASGDPCF